MPLHMVTPVSKGGFIKVEMIVLGAGGLITFIGETGPELGI